MTIYNINYNNSRVMESFISIKCARTLIFSGYIYSTPSTVGLARESDSSNTTTHEEAFAFLKFPSLLLFQTPYTRVDKDYRTAYNH